MVEQSPVANDQAPAREWAAQLALGLDAGGSGTGWVLLRGGGGVVARGQVAPLTAALRLG